MKPSRAEILTGAFVLATIAVGAVFLILVGSGRLFAARARFLAYVEDSANLRAHAGVHFQGSRVGEVAEIVWDGARRAHRLVLDVPPEVPVRADSTARIRAVALLGEPFVELSAGTPEAGPATPGIELRALPYRSMSESMGVLAGDVKPTLAELQALLTDLRGLLAPDRAAGHLEGALASAAKAAASLDRSAQALEALLTDPDTGMRRAVARLNTLLDGPEGSLAGVVAKADGAAGGLARVVNDAEVPLRDTLGSARTAMAELEATSRRLTPVLEELRRALAEVSGAAGDTLGRANRILRENEGELRAATLAARKASENLDRLTAKVAARPWTLLFESDDAAEAEAVARRDFEQALRERGRAGRYGKE